MNFSKVKLQQVQEKNFKYNSKIIKTPVDIVNYINSIEEMEKLTEEVTILIILNTKNQIISYSEIAQGGANYCTIDIKSIFKRVLLCNGTKFILVHNHPSGIADASKKDKSITKKIQEASKLMDIEFVDHIVIGENEYRSCFYEQQN